MCLNCHLIQNNNLTAWTKYSYFYLVYVYIWIHFKLYGITLTCFCENLWKFYLPSWSCLSALIFLCFERRKPEVTLSALFSLLAVSNQKKSIAPNNQQYPPDWFIYLFFSRRIIALQNFVVFCQTSTWIGHRCTYVQQI